MTETKPVVLSKISVYGKTVQLEYLCDLCYENPRLKRKHKTHLHGGGNAQSKCFEEIDWNKQQSFGTRVPHCSNIYIEHQRDRWTPFSKDYTRDLPEVELIYEPEITEIPFIR
jgi:hypothetical protein